jgi:hypothetical protein
MAFWQQRRVPLPLEPVEVVVAVTRLATVAVAVTRQFTVVAVVAVAAQLMTWAIAARAEMAQMEL